MDTTNGLFRLAAVLVACGLLAMSYRTLITFCHCSIALKLARIKARLAERGLAVQKNRYRSRCATMRLDCNCGRVNDHPPTTMKAGIHFPYGPDGPGEAYNQDRRYIDELITSQEKTAKNISDLITVVEKLTYETLAHDKEIEILQSKLADSIFILYGGKKLDGK